MLGDARVFAQKLHVLGELGGIGERGDVGLECGGWLDIIAVGC